MMESLLVGRRSRHPRACIGCGTGAAAEGGDTRDQMECIQEGARAVLLTERPLMVCCEEECTHREAELVLQREFLVGSKAAFYRQQLELDAWWARMGDTFTVALEVTVREAATATVPPREGVCGAECIDESFEGAFVKIWSRGSRNM